MRSLLNILKNILQRLDIISDFVIKQGTSGNWRYEKWHNGKVEVWNAGRKSAKGTSAGTSTLGYDFYVIVSIPNIFISVDTVSGVIANNPDTVGRWGAFVGWDWTASNATKLTLYTSGNYNNSNLEYSVRITGKWK